MNNIGTLCHWGPLIALSLISIISSCTVYCSLLWWPIDTQGGIINLTIFLSWVIATFYNFFRAIHLGPGYVPRDWKPVSELSEQIAYVRRLDTYITVHHGMTKTEIDSCIDTWLEYQYWYYHAYCLQILHKSSSLIYSVDSTFYPTTYAVWYLHALIDIINT